MAVEALQTDNESDGESTRTKKRERTARHLHVVRNESDSSERRPTNGESSPETKKEATSLAELFEVNFKKSEKKVAKDGTEAVDESGKFTKEGRQAVTSTLAEKEVQATPETPIEEAMTAEQKAAATGRAYLELVAETGDPEAAAAQIESEIGVTNEESAAVEVEIPSRLPELEEFEDTESNEIDEPQLWEAEEPAYEADSDPAALPEDEADFGETLESADEDEAGIVRPGPTSSSAIPTPASAPSPTGGGGGRPPRGAVPPFGGPPFGPNTPPAGSAGVNPNSARPSFITSGNLNTPPTTEIYDSGNPAVTALIGYLIGRRHGRRKAERKAAKDTRKYERKVKQQIEDINWQLKAKEQQIRKLAAAKARQERDMYVIPRPRPSDKEQVRLAEVARNAEKESKTASPVNRPGQPIEKATKAERQAAPEASQLHGSKALEHIGQMLVGAAELPLAVVTTWPERQAPPVERPGEAIKRPVAEQLPPHLTERHVETLNRQELLAMSEKIVVDGSSLRQIYETHLIGERGLRRLVAEHLHGGEVKKILRREIVEHEIDFERDPAVRDLPAKPAGVATQSGAAVPVNSKAAFDKLVQKASANMGDGNEQTAYYKARAAYEARQQNEAKQQRRVVDITLGLVITILAVAIVILYTTRR